MCVGEASPDNRLVFPQRRKEVRAAVHDGARVSG